ncbi:hypothetical protein ACFOWX_00080 [Sphingorhabdus arenilitoris]|uniref:Uncharacterized protein n=1 Tax=Sphingorhabdus arenilitoris TaxID=1490041 RepID=A0ABV8RD12_9SPHN
MADGFFDPPIFIKELQSKTVDLAATPYFFNDGGTPTYLAQVPNGVTPLIPAPTDPNIAIGREYDVCGTISVKPTPPYGVETQLGFVGDEIIFDPHWATRENAAAFGITLVQEGELVELSSPQIQLSQIEYEYGVFAGHWSPYQDVGNTLLSVVCTDLEHHDFPHIFASTDPEFPLVISVARYWPKHEKIRLADLWVPRGSALYIPPMPAVMGSDCIDLHNNRNSARACWGDIRQNALQTHTLLQTEGTFTNWFWNPKPTTHSNL